MSDAPTSPPPATSPPQATSAPQATDWDAALYQQRHGFVFDLAADLIALLAPRAGERILDWGCGTGQLSQQIAASGATVMGIDKAPSMIEAARANYPQVRFGVADGVEFQTSEPFDAIFSNAALHWMRPPEQVARRMHDALRSGGRLVAEFGGRGNVQQVLAAAGSAAASLGINNDPLLHANYFPAITEYAQLLEAHGFEVTFANLFNRPTPLEGGDAGLRTWLRMFRGRFVEQIPLPQQDRFFETLESLLRDRLWREGRWQADYRRLRVVAWRVD